MIIKPWSKENNDPQLSWMHWDLYGDLVSWKTGQLYMISNDIPCSRYLYHREWYGDSDSKIKRPNFVISCEYLMKDHGLTESEAKAETDKNIRFMSKGDVFMLLGTEYDDFIFSVLYLDSVVYISREQINLQRSVMELENA